MDGESEGVCLDRVDHQRGNVDVEYTAVVRYLPREVAVLQKETGCQRSHPRCDKERDYSTLVELEAVFEAGLCVLLNQIVLFLLGHQRTPGQLWKRIVES